MPLTRLPLGTAVSGNLDLANHVTGTLPAANYKAGSIIQYKFTTLTTQLSKVGTTGTVDMFTDLSITPVSSTSSFFVLFNAPSNLTVTNTANSIRFELHKNGSAEHTFVSNNLYRSSNDERHSFTGVYTGINNQSSTFTLNVAFRNGNYSETAKVSVSNDESTLSVYEIAG